MGLALSQRLLPKLPKENGPFTRFRFSTLAGPTREARKSSSGMVYKHFGGSSCLACSTKAGTKLRTRGRGTAPGFTRSSTLYAWITCRPLSFAYNAGLPSLHNI
jgi:hypothetical protein